MIKPHLEINDYKFDLTFDDEYIIYRETDLGNHLIIVPPNKQVIYTFIDVDKKETNSIYSMEDFDALEISRFFSK